MRKISILGSTGSIGLSALKVVDQFADRLEVVALACGSNADLLTEQVTQYQPAYAAVALDDPPDSLVAACKYAECQLFTGHTGAVRIAELEEVETVLAAMLGAAGLEPVLAAISKGKTIALANKETLVMAGELVLAEAAKSGSEMLPVDSEHNAIYQCLRSGEHEYLKRIILCASGGPFFPKPEINFDTITVDQALAHPRWKMGRKITIDSATMMNKGLEMIEARWLFGLEPEQVSVIIHPQSIVHSMVEYVDGSVIAQVGTTDMVMPIQYALSYPERWFNERMSLDIPSVSPLEFLEPDEERFPAISLSRQAMEAGGIMPVVLNAADELAVDAFLNERIRFSSIVKTVEETMARISNKPADGLETILSTDVLARETAKEIINSLAL